MSAENAVSLENSGRIYKIHDAKRNDSKEITALSHINPTIERDELFGLAGPKGAGKTSESCLASPFFSVFLATESLRRVNYVPVKRGCSTRSQMID